MLSYLTSLLHNNSFRYTGLVFYYKYLLIFFIPWIVIDVVNSRKRLIGLVSKLYLIYLLLIIWVYIYYILRVEGFIQGSIRVSYPFSNYFTSDSHVYSSYLGFTIIAYQEYIRKVLKHSIIHSFTLFIIASLALFINGSKSGVLVLFIYLLIIIYRFIKGLGRKKLKTLILTITLITLCVLVFISFNNDSKQLIDKELIELSTRTINYDLSNASFEGRVGNLFSAIAEIEHNLFIIGNGPIHSSKKWYDGGLSIVLAHSGIIGLISLALFCYYFIKQAKKLVYNFNSNELYKSLLILLFTYLLLSIITEHFLLTRNLLPIATLISVIYADMKQNYASIPTMQSHFN